MSWQIEIHRAKPNPTGKDKAGNAPIASQLLGEWIDLKNVGDANVLLSTLHLAHREFGEGCSVTTPARTYWNGPNSITLRPGQIVRVHTGRSSDAASMSEVDQQGADHHSYADRGSFVLNNECGDTLSVWWKHEEKWNKDDEAGYEVNPPEGAILKRVGDRLA